MACTRTPWIVVPGAVVGGVRPPGWGVRALGRGVVEVALVEQALEGVDVDAGGVEGVASAPVRQGEQRGDAHVLASHVGTSAPGGVGCGGAGGDDVGAHAVDVESSADVRDGIERGVGERHVIEGALGPGEALFQGGLLVGVPGEQRGRVVVEGETAAYHLGADARVTAGSHLDGETETVEQLGAQFALFGVHRADEHDLRGVADGDALAFDGVAPHRGGIQQHVDEMVGQQVHLVDVEHAAVGCGQQAGLEGGAALRERGRQVERAGEAVLARPDGQLDEAGAARLGVLRVSFGVGARGVGRIGGAGEPAADDDALRGQDVGEGAHEGRLGGALLAAHQHAADAG